MKRCTKCGQSKSLLEFWSHRWLGLQLHYWCRDCMKSAKQQYYRENIQAERTRAIVRSKAHRAILQRIKLERGCAECGYAEHPAALEFDHLPGEGKSFPLKEVHRALAKLLAETEKCDVVCANCHAVRTANRRNDGD